MKRFGLVVLAAALVSLGWTVNANEAWIRGVLKTGTSKVSLTNAAGNLSTTSGAFSADVTIGDDLVLSDLAAGATAGTGGQGNGVIATTITRVSTVTTSNDVTLPGAAAGFCYLVSNSDSADALDVFPASGDAINKETADTAISLTAGEGMFCCAVDATQWVCVIGSAT